jgi:hypothetical protein
MPNSNPSLMTDAGGLRRAVEEVVTSTPVVDMHTHLYAPQFGEMQLWGIDDLLTYHYLIAEVFRSPRLVHDRTSLDRFWSLSKSAQADLIWQCLFVDETPLSEATRGVVSVLNLLGLDPRSRDLREARAFFASRDQNQHVQEVLKLAGVEQLVMTNDPFDQVEAGLWARGAKLDTRFLASLRADRLLNDWETASTSLRDAGYRVSADLGGDSVKEIRRFLDSWIERMNAVYVAVSLPSDFNFPEESSRNRLISEAVLPSCREHNIPFALMIGVRRQVNPRLRLAGDALGKADAGSVARICDAFPENRFLVTMLSRENQHELCVIARKFNNLMPFGCWWFLNNPSIIDEITRERFELLGSAFIPQHSDARILDQLIYKWSHSRQIIGSVLADAYVQLLGSGRSVTRVEIERDATRLMAGNFRSWVGLRELKSGA